MTGFNRQIADTVDAVEILSATHFAWLGAPSSPLTREVRRRLSEADEREFLLLILTARLYESFYCSGRTIASAGAAGVDHRWGDPALIAALSRANTGSGCWEPGWTLRRRHARSMDVERNGLTLQAAPDECRPTTGSTVEVRLPKELLQMAPGFYMALLDQPLHASAPVVRLYWNLRADGALPFVREATGQLNAAEIGARLKVVNDPRRFHRCDAGVLYLGRDDLGVAAEIARGIHRAVAAHLDRGLPALTKRLADGVALAADPGDGQSFGEHRCRLIAEGVVRAYEQRLVSVEARVEAVREAMAAHGVDLEAPYRASEGTIGLDEWSPLT